MCFTVWWHKSYVNVLIKECKFSILKYFLCRVHSTWDAFSQILARGGVRGLWKGSIPNVQRAALVNLGDLTTYDTAKRFILTHTSLTDSHVTHILSR